MKKTITKGQLIDLFNANRVNSSYIETILDLEIVRHNHDDYIIKPFDLSHLIIFGNDKQKALLTQWGIIEPELKFKDGDWIKHRNGFFYQLICKKKDSGTFYYDKKYDLYLFADGSDDYNNSRLATPEEIEANTKTLIGRYFHHTAVGTYKITHFNSYSNPVGISKGGKDLIITYLSSWIAATEQQIKEFNEPELIKLEVGSFIYHPDFGVSKGVETLGITKDEINHKDKNILSVLFENKSGVLFHIRVGSQIHKELTYATAEQKAAFHCIWNEGQEEAKKYKDGQPCLVRDWDRNEWILKYADGKGCFYLGLNGKQGPSGPYNFHLPINSETIKNLPVNE
jgi:hypothetical protein